MGSDIRIRRVYAEVRAEAEHHPVTLLTASRSG